MTEQDTEVFAAAWSGAFEVYGKTISDAAISTCFEALIGYEIADITRALTAHLRDPATGQFPPKPADIIKRQAGAFNDGRPGPEEAWAMCPQGEFETAWMTPEMAAASASASVLLARGDRIAARKAFIETYESEVARARVAGTAAGWFKSLGFDTDGRNSPVNEGLAQKYLEAARHDKTEIEKLEWEGRRQLTARSTSLSMRGLGR